MSAPDRVTRDQVCLFRLAAHHLNLRLPADGLADAAAACGIQDTPPGSAAQALAARVEGLSAARLAQAVETDRDLVVLRSLRAAPHIVPVRDVAVFTTGLLPDSEGELRFFVRGAGPSIDVLGVTAAELVDLVGSALWKVLEGAPMPFRAVSAAVTECAAGALPPGQLPVWQSPGPYAEGQSLGEALVHFALYLLALRGQWCFAPREGREAALVRVDRWLGGPLPGLAPADARAELLRRYLRCYGPSTPRHFAEWAGVAPSFAARAWALVEPELVAVDFEGRRTWLCAGDLPLLRDPPMPGGVRLLPPHDPYLALRDRGTVLPDAGRHGLVWKAVGNPGAVLAGGQVAGLWRPQKRDGLLRITVEPLALSAGATRTEIEAEAARAAASRGCGATEVIFVDR